MEYLITIETDYTQSLENTAKGLNFKYEVIYVIYANEFIEDKKLIELITKFSMN